MQRTVKAQKRAAGRSPGVRIAVVVSRFNEDVTSRLLDGALACLRDRGVQPGHEQVVWCPGAFELPQVAGALLRRGRWDGIVCLGAVVRGETAHFEYVSAATAQGIQSTALTFGVPVGFGVLTTDTLEQAMERSGGKHGNKGWDTAEAVLAMVQVYREMKAAGKASGTGRRRR